MELRIKEFSERTGVSVRTLHYYDQMGLLKPARTDAHSGYRFYDEASFDRMQQILFFRELDFPLKTICGILSSPDYDKTQALIQQRELLILKKERLEQLIAAVDRAMKGEIIMDAFDNRVFGEYKNEAAKRWGKTRAYEEYTQKTREDFPDRNKERTEGMNRIMAEFARCKQAGNAPESVETQALVKALQAYITDNFYTCTNQILRGLGQMYVADERFKQNLDSHGEGTAAYISRAIEVHCK